MRVNSSHMDRDLEVCFEDKSFSYLPLKIKFLYEALNLRCENNLQASRSVCRSVPNHTGMANGMSSASQSTLEGSTSGSHDNPEELNIEKKRKSSSVDRKLIRMWSIITWVWWNL